MLKALVKVRIQAVLGSFSQSLGGKSKNKNLPGTKSIVGMTLLFSFLAIMLLFAFGSIAMMLGILFLPTAPWLYFGFLVSFAFLFSLFGSALPAKNQLFDSKDNDILIPMPIPPVYILLSRMIALLLTNFIYSMIILLPGIVVYFFFAPLTVGVVFGCFFGIVSLVLLSTTVSAFIGFVLAVISRFFRHKTFASIIFTVLFVGVYIVGYEFLFSVDVEDPSAVQNLLLMAQELFRGTPIDYVGSVFAGVPLPLVSSIAVTALLFCGLLILLSRGFLTVTSDGASTKKRKYVAKAEKNRGFRIALLKKDVQLLFSNATYFINAALGSILLCILAVALPFFGGGLVSSLTELEAGVDIALLKDILIAPVAFMALCFLSAAMVLITAPAISVEAKTLWMMQSLPVHPRDVLLSKVYLQLLMTLPPLLLCCIVGGVVLALPVYTVILIFIAAAAYATLSAVLGMTMNIWLPKFDAISVAHAAKQSAAVILTMLPMMLLCFGIGIGGIFLSTVLGSTVFFILAALFGFALSVPFLLYIFYGGSRRFSEFSV